MYKLHKRLQQLFLSYGNEIHTCATVKEHIEDKIFKISYIISHNINNNRGTALSTSKNYTYLSSNRSMISFGREHCKYDMHIYLHASFLGIAFKYFIIPPANFVCRGYTVFTLSVRPSVRPSVRLSVTLCFLNNSKSHCWIFIKPCKHVHICKTNTLDKKVRARGQFY